LKYYLKITPRDPIIARDGRPFGFQQGSRMRSADWIYPSVLAGSLRTLLGKTDKNGFSKENIERLKEISVAGPFPMVDNSLYFPAPRDLMVYEEKDGESGKSVRKMAPLRPMNPTEENSADGCNLPPGLRPVAVPVDEKPVRVPSFWSQDIIFKWLADATGEPIDTPPSQKKANPNEGYLHFGEKAIRFHAQIDSGSGTAQEGMLFATEGIDFNLKSSRSRVTLAARVEGGYVEEKGIELNHLHPMGGERRLVHWSTSKEKREQFEKLWQPPGNVIDAFQDAKRIRAVLATPAIFNKGWKPEWINDSLEGELPETKLKIKLIAACVDRWRPVSGWSLEDGIIGPKPIYRMVPAGSVYFFEITGGGNISDEIKKIWLKSVSDKPHHRKDGFGLALWGVWNYSEENSGGNKA
jgi:CRISPR-associated protein Cmr3